MNVRFRHDQKAAGVRTLTPRVAFVVSHPIQYTAPLYQRLAKRGDVAIKVFFSRHAGGAAVQDRGFARAIAWDIPLTAGYEFEHVASDLLGRVLAWQPDVVHVTGWASFAHMKLLCALHHRGVPTLFFGDSHLLDGESSLPKRSVKAAVLRKIYSWPQGFLTAGTANRAYFEKFGVSPNKLYPCPHSIDVKRFAEPAKELEREAACWRGELGIEREQKVLVFAGKFEPKKRPLELMRSMPLLHDRSAVLVLVGGGELQREIETLAATSRARFRILPFQNQSRMPVVYRLGDIFVLPSGWCETWGVAVNEALACGRPVVVSDRVGCAADLINPACGRKFAWDDWRNFARAVDDLLGNEEALGAMRRAAAEFAWCFDTSVMESDLMAAIEAVGSVRPDCYVAARRRDGAVQ